MGANRWKMEDGRWTGKAGKKEGICLSCGLRMGSCPFARPRKGSKGRSRFVLPYMSNINIDDNVKTKRREWKGEKKKDEKTERPDKAEFSLGHSGNCDIYLL